MSKKKHEGESEVNLGSVVTPMLDMSFQILFFFVATFTPYSTIEGAMEFHMPPDKDVKAAKSIAEMKPEDVPDTTEALTADVTVVVKSVSNEKGRGHIEQITFQMEGPGSGQAPIKVEGEFNDARANSILEKLRVDLEALQKDARIGNKENIKISASLDLKCDFVVRVMDVCRKAGFKRVGFAAPPSN